MAADPKKIVEKEVPKICRVVNCFIKSIDGNYCRYHKVMITGSKSQQMGARLDAKMEEHNTSRKLQPKKKKNNKSPFQKSVTLCDTVFSQYVRLYYSDSAGFCQCITSGKMMFWKHPKRHTHAGHFESRKFMNTRWDITNVHPQHISENSFNEGNKAVMHKAIDKLHGEGTAEGLLAKSRITKNWEIFEIKELIKFYRAEVRKLKKEKRL